MYSGVDEGNASLSIRGYIASGTGVTISSRQVDSSALSSVDFSTGFSSQPIVANDDGYFQAETILNQTGSLLIKLLDNNGRSSILLKNR